MSWNFIVSDYFVVEILLSGISLLAVMLIDNRNIPTYGIVEK
jgi:hypothetical protein